MTTKTTSLAMFAIAAFALVGIAGAPAFAATQNTTADNSHTANTSCWGNNMSSVVTPYSNEDKVKVVLDSTACNSFESVRVDLYVETNFYGSVTVTDDYKELSFNVSGLSVGNSVQVLTFYEY